MPDPTFTPFVPTWLTPDAIDPTMATPFSDVQVPVDPSLAPGGEAGLPFAPVSPPVPGPVPMQPGIGIPQSMFDQAAGVPPTQPSAAPVDAPFPEAPNTPAPRVAFDQTTTMDPFARAPSAPAQPQDPYADVDGVNPLTNPDLSADDAASAMTHLNATNPQLAARFAAEWQQDREDDVAQEALVQAHADARRARESLELQQKAVEQANHSAQLIEADAMSLSQKKIDPTRFARNRTTGQRLWDLIGAVAGGAFAGAAGRGDGRNLFLEGWEKDADRDIDAQAADIANGWQGINARRGIVADIYARSGDLYHAKETARLAIRMSARDALLAEQQLFDPKGTRAMKIAGAVAQVDASIAANQRLNFEKGLELQLKLQKEQREQQEAADKHAAAAAKLAKAGAGSTKSVLSPAAFAHKNGLKVWGEAEKKMYSDYVAKTNVTSAATSRAAVPAPLGSSPMGALPTTPGVTPAPVGMTPTASGARAKVPTPIAKPAADAVAPAAPTAKYKNKEDWFSANLPTVEREDRKRFWFVDGNNGNDVPPVEFESGVDPEKFIEKQSKRKALAEKLDQLRVLTEKLQKRGLWDKAVSSKVSWRNDADVQEARGLSELVTGDVIQDLGMGVPSGDDVKRVQTMKGGDPAGWQDPTPALQRYRESLQLAQDRDWEAAAPSAAKSADYNRFRVLPTASPEWVKKFAGRGVVKEITPELGNTDPKQLQGRTVAGDAPDATQAAANDTRSRRTKEALDYLTSSGAVSLDDSDVPDELSLKKTSSPQNTPQTNDFRFAGAPQAGEKWKRLRDLHVNSVALLNKYVKSGDVEQWKGFKKSERESGDVLNELFEADPGLYRKYISPGANYVDHVDFTPEAIAHLTGEIIRTGGRR